MKNVVSTAALLGLAFTAITNSFWSWLIAVIAIAATLYAGRNARLITRVQLILVAALAGGLGAEIVTTIYYAATETTGPAAMYRQVLIVSLGSAIIVFVAMIAEHWLRKHYSSGEKQSQQ